MKELEHIVNLLAEEGSYASLFHRCTRGEPLPSVPDLKEIVKLCRSVIFPGYFGVSTTDSASLRYHIGISVERLYALLTSQIHAGLSFNCDCRDTSHPEAARDMARQFIERLPQLRAALADDVRAIFDGDPAAENIAEVISCYPSVRAVSSYRIAHALLEMGVPLIPRAISELAHGETGVDIHPGATVGSRFAIDHGTGVVIGATCIIGNNVKIYQGVTLGARSFPLDDATGLPVKGIPRHPIIGDNVIIYSNATILGRVTIGDGATVGANVWLTHDVAPGATIYK